MELSQQLIAVSLVLGLLALCLVVAQRKGLIRFDLTAARPRAHRHMELIDRMALTPHHGLYVVRSGDQILLIATHPRGVNLVEPRAAQGDTGPPIAAAASASAFATSALRGRT
jgi:flagellar biogenesis protein FliO